MPIRHFVSEQLLPKAKNNSGVIKHYLNHVKTASVQPTMKISPMIMTASLQCIKCTDDDEQQISDTFCMFVAKKHTVFKWKDVISGFPVSRGSAEPPDRWGGKAKHRLIWYFLINTSAKNFHNQIMYVKIIESQRWDVFLRHSVLLHPFNGLFPWQPG